MSAFALVRHRGRSRLSTLLAAGRSSSTSVDQPVLRSGLARTLLVLLVAVSLLGFSVSSASASLTHVFSLSFGSTGAGAGQVSLAGNSGVAVNATTHDVYVADAGNNRVDQFSSAGVFIRAWGWGVADGLPALESCSLTCQQGTAGTGAGQLSAPTFIAVDNSGSPSAGDVYVGDAGSNTVSKFSCHRRVYL